MAEKTIETREALGITAAGDKVVMRRAEDETEPPALIYGADPAVVEGKFDPSDYDIPGPEGETVRLEDFGGRVGLSVEDGKANAAALVKAAAVIKTGGILELNGVYGLFGSTNLVGLRGATIMGQGWETGFAAVDQPFPGGRWRSLVELRDIQDVVVINLSVNVRGQPIGGLYHQNDHANCWFVNLHLHDIGGSSGSAGKPLAAFKGSDGSKGFNLVGCLIEKGVGDAGPGSGVRGYYNHDEGARNTRIEHCVFRGMGHTGCAVAAWENCVVRYMTSERNAGAGLKTTAPSSVRDGHWTPSGIVMTVEHCLLVDNGAVGRIPWAYQCESPGTLVRHNKMTGHTAAISTWAGWRAIEITHNQLLACDDAGIWINAPRNDTPQVGPFNIHHNTIRGALNRAGVAMHPHVDRPSGACIIAQNNIPAGKTTVQVTPVFEAHGGYEAWNNGPNGPGAG